MHRHSRFPCLLPHASARCPPTPHQTTPHHTTVAVHPFHPTRRELAKPGYRVGMLSDSLTLAQAMLRQAAGTCTPACLRAYLCATGFVYIYIFE